MSTNKQQKLTRLEDAIISQERIEDELLVSVQNDVQDERQHRSEEKIRETVQNIKTNVQQKLRDADEFVEDVKYVAT